MNLWHFVLYYVGGSYIGNTKTQSRHGFNFNIHPTFVPMLESSKMSDSTDTCVLPVVLFSLASLSG